jgi:lysyl-tRNA synthetase, class II
MDSAESDFSKLMSSLPYSYETDSKAVEITANYSSTEGKEFSLAGRAIGVRKAGKLVFVDLLDSSGKIQCYFDFNSIGEEVFKTVKSLNVGDILGVKGKVFKTKPGEISINVVTFQLLAKAKTPLPPQWFGIKDVEKRYRKRYLDLIMNPEARDIATKRSMAVSALREFLDKRGFLEFETPTIQPLYGGADAEPFKVFVNTLGEEHYMRISNELYLKRLIIGGFEKVYEVYRAFRNEDIDSTHSPEFTMVEWYQAYADYNDVMRLTEELIRHISKKINASTSVEYQGKNIDFAPEFKRVEIVKSINDKVGKDVLKISDDELFKEAEKRGIRFEKGKRNRPHAYDKLFSLLVQPELVQPTFIIDFPRDTSPLTRPKRGNPELAERFELYIAGMEIANAYSELNNPVIQRENFEEQEKRAAAGDKEAEPLDMDFVEAMEYGMPPTGGNGVGIDRLVMILTNQTSIKEVILFPMEKRTKKQ